MGELTSVERLERQRDKLEGLLADETDGAKAAALSRELRAVMSDLEKLGGEKKGSRVDEIAKKRAARLAKAKGSGSAAARK